jgi:hypothetical protein
LTLALAGPVWGFLGLLITAIAAGVFAVVNGYLERDTNHPFREHDSDLEGLKASVESLLPTVAFLRSELDRVNTALQECIKRDADKGWEIIALRAELVDLKRIVDGYKG